MEHSLSAEQAVQEDQYVFPYHYLSLHSELYRRFLHAHYLAELTRVIALLKPFNGECLLDIGTGDGRFLYELRDENLSLAGVDYSEQAIRFAAAFNPKANLSVQNSGSVSTGTKVDIVTMIQVLEHIPLDQVDSVASQIGQLVKPGGRLLVSVPSVNLKLSAKHYQHFTEESLVRVFSRDFRPARVLGHIDARGWRKFEKMKRNVAVLFPISKKSRSANWYLNRVEAYFASILEAKPRACHTLIALFVRNAS